jgi:ferredoxin-NADP reductase/Na+-translocating ferredoxin:NAD+ oxidoreductase RnfD subunit
LYNQPMSMYRLVLYLLAGLVAVASVLSGLGWLPYVWWHILGSAVFLLAVCFVSNQVFAYLFKVRVNFESQFITALILALILGPGNPLDNWLFLSVAAVVSQASKYLLAYKGRHIFNPAALAVLFTALVLNEGASWWVGNIYLNVLVVAGVLFIKPRSRWLPMALAFLVAYTLPVLTQTADLSFFLHLPIFFFAFVMLTEPLTAPVGRNNKIFYGAFIAAILFLLQTFTIFPYTLELSLVLGNLAFWLAKKNKEKLSFNFDRQETSAQNIFAFWFSPATKFDFVPGQYIEWNLPHDKADDHGTRRWFTIASSPTENRVLLATKIGEKSTSFKTALKSLAQGTRLTSTDPDGEFTLPKDPDKKLVFIAGGIGITPFRSIAKFLIDTNQKRNIVLLYSAKTAGEFAFKDIWTEGQKNGLKPIYVATDEKGYINPEMIKQEIPDWNDRIFYLSGPEPMVNAFEKMLSGMGVKKIKRDFFPGYTEKYN